jgi:hypothetical protein
LIDVCKASFTPAPVFETLHRVIDVKSWLTPFFNKLKGIAEPHQILIKKCAESATGSSVHTAKWSDSPFTAPVQVISQLPPGCPMTAAGRPAFYSKKDKDGKGAVEDMKKCKAQVEKIADMNMLEDPFTQWWDKEFEDLEVAATTPAELYGGWWPESKEDVASYMQSCGAAVVEDFDDEQADRAARILDKEDDARFRGFQYSKGGTYENQDPKKNNFAIVYMRTADFTPEQEAALLGNWEKYFSVCRIVDYDKPNKSDPVDDPKFRLKVYEPYHEESDMPLWAWKQLKARSSEHVSTEWEDVLKLPWKEVTQMPLSTWDAFYSDHAYKKDAVVPNWKGTGLPVVSKLPKDDAGFKDGVLRLETHYSNLVGVFRPSKSEDAMYARAAPGKRVHRFDKEEWDRLTELPEALVAKRACPNYNNRPLQPRPS